MPTDDFTFSSVTKDPGESRHVTLDLFGKCANFWQPNEFHDDGDFIRPTRANGFSYEYTTEGTSGSREPVYPKVVGATVTDGSAVLTCRAAGTNGVNAITSPSAVSDPTGLTIGSVSVEESTKILATYSGGSLDQDYDAVFTFTLNGVTRVARQRVEVRKR